MFLFYILCNYIRLYDDIIQENNLNANNKENVAEKKVDTIEIDFTKETNEHKELINDKKLFSDHNQLNSEGKPKNTLKVDIPVKELLNDLNKQTINLDNESSSNEIIYSIDREVIKLLLIKIFKSIYSSNNKNDEYNSNDYQAFLKFSDNLNLFWVIF